jgi:hypothetical protein
LERQAIIHWREVGPHKFSPVKHGVVHVILIPLVKRSIE